MTDHEFIKKNSIKKITFPFLLIKSTHIITEKSKQKTYLDKKSHLHVES